ncbi:hypothetical protein ACI3L1_19570 [Deinococcus sp. SM5_A1]|uniref:hypothetical protein n=1 Tax=Deinococcus sp. SM5_A1 TaxID=3379094 RepID=UPI00385A6E27
MNITIVMVEGKTLYVAQASAEQQVKLRSIIADGHGVFEFTQDDRTYFVNAINILYVEATV